MHLKDSVHSRFLLTIVLLLACVGLERGWAQDHGNTSPLESPSLSDAVRQMQAQMQRLQTEVQELKDEADRSRAENLQLTHELQRTREKLESLAVAVAPPADRPQVYAAKQPGPDGSQSGEKRGEGAIAKIADDLQLLSEKVDEQYQTKVESASKYRLKLSGMVLFNLFSDTGNVEQIETPSLALPMGPADPTGSFGGSIRQSQVGLETYGPTVAGARVSGNLVVDLFGAFSDTLNGFSTGSFRLRTGTARLDWSNTSLIAGQDELFFSPAYPTSFASVSVPPLAYSGNLYGWIPQVRVERRVSVSKSSTVSLSAGILDPLTGESPTSDFLRAPGAGEKARQPAYGARVAWTRRCRAGFRKRSKPNNVSAKGSLALLQPSKLGLQPHY